MIPRLHVVSDDRVLARPDFAARARALLAAGGDRLALHLRGRATPVARLYALADELLGPARAADAALLANDRVDLALAADLDGVHLPERGLPPAAARALLPAGRVIGLSVHGEGTPRAVVEGADYLVVGAVYGTASHPDRTPTGVGLVERVAAGAGRPVLAIGGVTPPRVAELRAAGAHGVAVLGGVWGAPDPAEALRGYLDALA